MGTDFPLVGNSGVGVSGNRPPPFYNTGGNESERGRDRGSVIGVDVGKEIGGTWVQVPRPHRQLEGHRWRWVVDE